MHRGRQHPYTIGRESLKIDFWNIPTPAPGPCGILQASKIGTRTALKSPLRPRSQMHRERQHPYTIGRQFLKIDFWDIPTPALGPRGIPQAPRSDTRTASTVTPPGRTPPFLSPSAHQFYAQRVKSLYQKKVQTNPDPATPVATHRYLNPLHATAEIDSPPENRDRGSEFPPTDHTDQAAEVAAREKANELYGRIQSSLRKAGTALSRDKKPKLFRREVSQEALDIIKLRRSQVQGCRSRTEVRRVKDLFRPLLSRQARKD